MSHVTHADAPVTLLKVPAGQSVQDVLPALELKVAIGHSSQGDTEKKPDFTTCREPAGQKKENVMSTAPALPEWALQVEGGVSEFAMPHPA